jgi:hypothetical protein
MVGVSLAAFAVSASIFAMFLYLTLYLQEVLGYGPFAAGLRFLPITVLAFLVAPLSGKLTVLVQSRYLMSLGLALVALGCALSDHVQADSAWTVLLPGFVLAGIGLGFLNPVLASATISVVPPERSGMASGSSSTFRQVGISTGIAGLGAVFLSQIRPNTVDALDSSATGRTCPTPSPVATCARRPPPIRRGRCGTPSSRPTGSGSPPPSTISWTSPSSSPWSVRSGASSWSASATSCRASVRGARR